MRKSGLTSGTFQHLTQLASKSYGMMRRSTWEDEAEGASIEDGLDPKSDDALFLDHEDQVEFDLSSESTEPVTEDSSEDYKSGVEEFVYDADDSDAAMNVEPEPWNDAWEITRARRKSYDIRNYYQEGSVDPTRGPVSIHVGILIEAWSNLEDSNLADLESYIQDIIRFNLKMGSEYQLIVEIEATTPDAGLTEAGIQVLATFDGIEPSDSEELQTLIEGLVMKAIMTYPGAEA